MMQPYETFPIPRPAADVAGAASAAKTAARRAKLLQWVLANMMNHMSIQHDNEWMVDLATLFLDITSADLAQLADDLAAVRSGGSAP